MFWKRMRVNIIMVAVMLFVLGLYTIHPSAAFGAIAIFFSLNTLLEWEEECERREKNEYKRIND